MSTTGASSITNELEYAGVFRTKWGEDTYTKKMIDLHNMPTVGQRLAIIDEIRALERVMIGKSNSNMDRAVTEYEDTMQSIELYEKLVEEGK